MGLLLLAVVCMSRNYIARPSSFHSLKVIWECNNDQSSFPNHP